jgi:hypothetical protein
VAEQAPDPADYPGARPELLVPFSTVFVPPRHRVSLADPHNWWRPVPGADWRHPQGPGSSIRNKPDHPVVQDGLTDRDRPGRPKAGLELTGAERGQLTRWARRAKSSQAPPARSVQGGARRSAPQIAPLIGLPGAQGVPFRTC